MRGCVRTALARFASLSLAAADDEKVPLDVNVEARDAILELVRTHVTGPLKSGEFQAAPASWTPR